MEKKWLILSSVAFGTFMATLDSSIVNVALPSITAAFHTGLSFSRWVVISYLFSITALLLFFGKLADVFGRKGIFNIGFITFTVGSLLCGLSSTIGELIGFRALQGVGAAMLMANGPAIITAAFPANERGKALGTLAMVVSAGLAVGPTVGGLLVRFLSWSSIFFVNIPFGIAGAILVHRFVPTNAEAAAPEVLEGTIVRRIARLPWSARLEDGIQKMRYFDWLGVVLWMVIQLGYSLAIDRENVLGLAGPLQKLISFGSAGLLILFLIWEWSVKDPVLDLSLFKSRIFLLANLSALFNFVAISSITLLMPFYFQSIRGLPPHKVGALMTAIPLTIFFVAPISGRLSDVYGSRFLSTLGMCMVCGAMVLLGLPWQGLESEHSVAQVVYLVLVGVGIGLFQSPNNNAIMGAVQRSHLGVASALLATVRNLGLVTGAAISTSLLMQFYAQQVLFEGLQVSPSQNFITAMRHTFLSLAAVCAVGVLTSMARGKGNLDGRAN